MRDLRKSTGVRMTNIVPVGSFPPCGVQVAPRMRDALRELGAQWGCDSARPSLKPRIATEWDRLISAWIADPSMPLLIRKFRENRGQRIVSAGGRALIPTDNSPAQWAFAVAFAGHCPGVSEIHDLLNSANLPVAMMFGAKEKTSAVYRGARNQCVGTSDAGWKLAHVEAVGLGGRGPLIAYDSHDLERHFRLFMSPSNMFVVPARWAGLAEVDDFVSGFRATDLTRARFRRDPTGNPKCRN